MRAVLEDMSVGEGRAMLRAHFPEPRPDLVLVDGGGTLFREPGGFAVRRSGPNWPVIALIIGAHAALLLALITLDVIPILKAPKPKPMVVEMLTLKPPPPVKPEKKVELRADETAFAELATLHYQPLQRATEADWSTEYLDLILALRVIDSPNEAIAHVGQFGSHHSDCIVTRDPATAEQFLSEVDSATVYWNASTRFTDGGEFGFGAEIGISTDKLHARGPMGLEELTTYKYVIRGSGQVRS